MASQSASISLSPNRGSAAPSRLALVLLIVGGAALGGSGVWVKVSELGPAATGFYRMALAFPLMWLWMGLMTRRASAAGVRTKAPGGATVRDAALIALAGLFFAGDILTWHWALQFTSVANATFLGNLAPIFVTMGVWILFGDRPTLTFVLGLGTAIAGAALMMRGGVSFGENQLAGDALSLAAAIFFAAYLIVVARLRRRLSTSRIMTWSTFVSAVALFPSVLISGEALVAPSLTGWALLLGFAIFSQAGGQTLAAYALAHLPTAFSSVGLLVGPVAASILAWFVLGESLTPGQAAGGAVVLAGIVLAQRGGRAETL